MGPVSLLSVTHESDDSVKENRRKHIKNTNTQKNKNAASSSSSRHSIKMVKKSKGSSAEFFHLEHNSHSMTMTTNRNDVVSTAPEKIRGNLTSLPVPVASRSQNTLSLSVSPLGHHLTMMSSTLSPSPTKDKTNKNFHNEKQTKDGPAVDDYEPQHLKHQSQKNQNGKQDSDTYRNKNDMNKNVPTTTTTITTTSSTTTTTSDCPSCVRSSEDNNNSSNNHNNGHDQHEHHHNHHHHQANEPNNGRHHHKTDGEDTADARRDNFHCRHPALPLSSSSNLAVVNAMEMSMSSPMSAALATPTPVSKSQTNIGFDVDVNKENAGNTPAAGIMQLSPHNRRRQCQRPRHRRPYDPADQNDENEDEAQNSPGPAKHTTRASSSGRSSRSRSPRSCKNKNKDGSTRENEDHERAAEQGSEGNNKSGKNKNNNFNHQNNNRNRNNHDHDTQTQHPPHDHQHHEDTTTSQTPVSASSSSLYSTSTRSSRSSASSSSSYKWSRIMLLAICQMASVLSQALNPGPKFGEPIPNVTVAVGRDASLPCVVENLGNHKVAWVHIDRRMILTIHKHIVTRIPRFSVSYDSHKTWLLHVNSVQQEDRGYYMCQVNTEPMISQVGYLQVVVPPNICDNDSSESHVAIREQLNITLNCKAEGFPEPRITWKREDGQPFAVDRRRKVNSSDGERLQLYRISRLEMGAYLCIASNGVPPSVSKRIIVDVEFSPMIWVPNQLVGAPSGTNVTLECNTEAFPRAISYWVYDDMMILTTGKYNTESIESSYRTHMRLTIRNLRDKDFGRYRCLSKNSLGEAEGAIRLYEIPQPSQQPKATEVRHNQDSNSPVNVVRLTPIPKTDDKRKWPKEIGGKMNKEVQQGRGGVGGGGINSVNNGDNSIHVPSIDPGSVNSKGSSVRHFSAESYLMMTGVSFLVSAVPSLLSWSWNWSWSWNLNEQAGTVGLDL